MLHRRSRGPQAYHRRDWAGRAAISKGKLEVRRKNLVELVGIELFIRIDKA